MAQELFFNGFCLEEKEVPDLELPEVVRNTTGGNALEMLGITEPTASPLVPGLDPRVIPQKLEDTLLDPVAQTEAQAARDQVLAGQIDPLTPALTPSPTELAAAGSTDPAATAVASFVTDRDADGRDDKTGQFVPGPNHPAAKPKGGKAK